MALRNIVKLGDPILNKKRNDCAQIIESYLNEVL